MSNEMPDNLRRISGLRARPYSENHKLTDLGNAERFAELHGEDVRYVYAWGQWLVWDGKRWAPDDTGWVERKAKSTVRSIDLEAANTQDEGYRKALRGWANRSEARSRIEAMLGLARSEPGIPVTPDELDRDTWLLNCENGTIDLKTGQLRRHRQDDLITKIAPVEYHPDAQAPTWEAFLERVLPSESLRTFVQRVVGYSLTGDVSEQVLPFLYGPGANGKSTLINTLLEMMGGYGMQAAPDLLVQKRGTHPTELADLFGARFVASVEVEDGRRLAESLVKQLTGGDRIKARYMRQDFWEFDPTHKVLLAANHQPEVRGTDHAIWRRIKLIPFDVTIPKAEQDPKLPEKLREELPGILAWAVRGCLDWQREGLGEPDEVKSATESYRAEMDLLGEFFSDHCVIDERAQVGATALYTAYKEWCKAREEEPEKQNKFGRQLRERGFQQGKKDPRTRRTTWKGISLLNSQEEPL